MKDRGKLAYPCGMHKVWRPLVSVLTLAALFVSLAVPAQTPTAEQLQIFQNLTPEQQRAVLDGLNSGDSGRDTQGAPATKAVTPDMAAVRKPAETVPAVPVLGVQDSVVLELSVATDAAAVDRDRLADIAALVLSRNPYALDRNG